MTTPVMTTYKYRLKPGVNSGDLMRSSAKVQGFIEQWQGFQYRSLAKTQDDVWLDNTYWENHDLLGNL